jgi:hypothetical protein
LIKLLCDPIRPLENLEMVVTYLQLHSDFSEMVLQYIS